MTRALVTRPAEDAAEIAQALESRGVSVLIEPLLTIRPKADVKVDLAGVQALLFTSANGARAFGAIAPGRDLPALAVGDGTAEALRRLGFARIESAGGAVEDLERLVRRRLDPSRGKLLHIAGTSVAGDLAGRLAQSGFEVARVALYDAEPATELSRAAQDELAAGRIDWVLVFSPRTAATFASVIGRAGLQEATRKVTLLALSDAVAKAAALPFRRVAVAAEPTQAALLAAADEVRSKDKMTTETKPTAPPPQPRRHMVPLVIGAVAIVAVVIAGVVAIRMQSETAVPMASAPVASAPPAVSAPVSTDSAPVASAPSAVSVPTPTVPAPVASAPSTAPATADPVDLAPLLQRLDKLDAAAIALGQRLDGVAQDAQRAGAKASAAADAAAARPAETPASPPVDLAPVEKRLAALEQSLADVARRVSANADTDKRLAALEQSLADVTRRVSANADADKRLAEVERLVKSDRRLDAAALAALKLGDALAAGRPYKTELALLAGVPDVAAEAKLLSARAESGIPTRAVLIERFTIAAAAASRAGEHPDDLWSQVLAKLKGLVSIRRVQPGDDLDGVLARAELALKTGDLAGALAALDRLPAGAAPALASWRAEAEARLQAERALDRAIQALAAGLARPG